MPPHTKLIFKTLSIRTTSPWCYKSNINCQKSSIHTRNPKETTFQTAFKMDVVHCSARARAARPRPVAFRAAAAALTRPYKRWPKIERELAFDCTLHRLFRTIFSTILTQSLYRSACVDNIERIYLHKSRPRGPRSPLITKISNYILVSETGTSSLLDLPRMVNWCQCCNFTKYALKLFIECASSPTLFNVIYPHLQKKIEKVTTNTNLSYKMEIFRVRFCYGR